MRFQFLPHFVDGPRRARDAVLFAKTIEGVALSMHPADLVDDQLELLIEEVPSRLHLHELAGVELIRENVHILEDLGPDLT